ncbi:uncharacterized protein TrAFT101_000626 [Trichoderma asperellum]|uniref:Uncharacterized protein n=1 Tax=Trichoderma asperellum (strain ATCC 204424 / CBS 433.97 / NBRC 101777) TaxID=1042311 RepID=A0A2T3ZK30_TRIA4|nr:hypothetical protein M441DRAFT_308983 [Trichoderma asperellum CBS 433.97]PTB45167.1 hypothetical protein M441DRAFT_308983 [Trichoderma asperellum CBS 433.97]UKZ84729.1 hypothetical protein TrAFT101_000626 [Trichoderma asperellum]
MRTPKVSGASPSLLGSQTTSTYRSPSLPSRPISSRPLTPASISVTSLATSERLSTPQIDVAATSSLYWELTIPPPFRVPPIRRSDRRSLALSGDTYSEIRYDGPLRLTDEMTYYLAL